MIEAVIFDMDGTMIPNTPFHKKAWFAFCKNHDIHFSENDWNKIAGKRNDTILEILFGRKIDKKEYKKLDEEKESMYRELYKPHITEVKGLKDLLKELEQYHYKLGVATTSPKRNRSFALQALGLQNTFDVIIGGEDINKGKPDPEIYLLIAEKLSVNPADCLAFEDTPSGVKSAKSAGMKVVGILTGHTKEELSDADFVIRNFTEISIKKIKQL